MSNVHRYVSMPCRKHYANQSDSSSLRGVRHFDHWLPADDYMRHVCDVSSTQHKRRRRGDVHSRGLPVEQRALVLFAARVQHSDRDQDRPAPQSRNDRLSRQHQECSRHSKRQRRSFRRLYDQSRRRHATDCREDGHARAHDKLGGILG